MTPALVYNEATQKADGRRDDGTSDDIEPGNAHGVKGKRASTFKPSPSTRTALLTVRERHGARAAAVPPRSTRPHRRSLVHAARREARAGNQESAPSAAALASLQTRESIASGAHRGAVVAHPLLGGDALVAEGGLTTPQRTFSAPSAHGRVGGMLLALRKPVGSSRATRNENRYKGVHLGLRRAAPTPD